MFFIMAVMQGKKEFPLLFSLICPQCGNLEKATVFMTYSYFSLFFIPLFKWNKQYFIKMDCCDTVYILDEGLGKRVSQGDDIVITESDLISLHSSAMQSHCPNCGIDVDRDFDFCPKCGHKL